MAAKIIDEMEIDLDEALHGLVIRIRHPRLIDFRLWAMGRLFQFASWVGGVDIELETVDRTDTAAVTIN